MPQPDTLGRIRILLAEDNKVNQMVARQVLAKLGYTQVEIAQNGQEAIEAWGKQRPDPLILMDCHMPEMDGYEATRRIRELEGDRGSEAVPIIAMTASAMTGDREFCLAAGMNDYTTKPIDRHALALVLKKAIAGGAEKASC